MQRKAQSATEFTLLTSFMLFVFIIFFVIIQNKIVDIQEQRNVQYVRSIANALENEVNLAEGAAVGYTRVFTLPYDIGGEEYTIEFASDEVLITFKDIKYPVFFSSAIGSDATIGPGNNIIQTKTGSIAIQNSSAICGNNIIEKPNINRTQEECDGTQSIACGANPCRAPTHPAPCTCS